MSDKPETIEESDAHLAGPQDLLSSKQIEKLNLEIKNLRNKKKRIEAFSPLFPVIASLLTVVALVIGFWQFQTQQQREFATGLQNQLRGDVDQILRFAHDEKQTISMVSFLLDDMKILIDSASKGTDDQLAEAFTGSERRVTKALVEQIVNDTDFEKDPRDIIFASKIVTNWKDYQKYFKEENQFVALDRILANYVKAMSKFRESKAAYLDNGKYDSVLKAYVPPPGYDSNVYQTLSYTLRGFKEHLNLLPGGTEAKKKFLVPFELALCNESLAKDTLGDDFIYLQDCSKQ